jgi:hypothetical protein
VLLWETLTPKKWKMVSFSPSSFLFQHPLTLTHTSYFPHSLTLSPRLLPLLSSHTHPFAPQDISKLAGGWTSSVVTSLDITPSNLKAFPPLEQKKIINMKDKVMHNTLLSPYNLTLLSFLSSLEYTSLISPPSFSDKLRRLRRSIHRNRQIPLRLLPFLSRYLHSWRELFCPPYANCERQ